MKDEKVSVLMCVFNTGGFLCQSIDSVLGQTHQNIEFIIIDDASTDDSWQIICSYSERTPQIKTTRNPINQGMSAALNKGLELSSGDYITRQDSDDRMLPERLAEQIAYLRRHPDVAAVGSNVRYIDPQDQDLGTSSYPIADEAIQKRLPDVMCFCGPTILIRTDYFRRAGFYYAPHSAAEDYDLCLRLAEVGKMANIEQPLYLYRQRPDSFSYLQRHFQMYSKVRSLEQATFRRFGLHPSSEFIDYIARDYLRAAILGAFNNEIASSRKCLEIALRYRRDLLNSPSLQPPLREIIRRYLPIQPIVDSIADIERLFRDLLPDEAHLKRLKAHLVAELYIEEVFARAQNSLPRTFDLDLVLKGVRHNPGWLRNRGIQSILVKQPILNARAAYNRRRKQSI